MVPPDGKTSEELVLEGLSLSHGAEGTVGHTLGVELDLVLGEVEPLLDDRGELADPAALLTEHLLGAGGTDDDLHAGRGLADLDARVTLLGKLASEELVQLRVEHSIVHKLKRAKKRNRLIDRSNAARLRMGSIISPHSMITAPTNPPLRDRQALSYLSLLADLCGHFV